MNLSESPDDVARVSVSVSSLFSTLDITLKLMFFAVFTMIAISEFCLLNRRIQAEQNSIQVIIAGAGGAAHLPGMVASHTYLPVIGVPIQSSALNGLDIDYLI